MSATLDWCDGCAPDGFHRGADAIGLASDGITPGLIAITSGLLPSGWGLRLIRPVAQMVMTLLIQRNCG
jgi:hypothetical protein